MIKIFFESQLVRYEGWHAKNMALKGRASQNCMACKNGVNQTIPSSFAVTASVIMQTFATKFGLWRSERNSNFSGEHAPRLPSSVLCAPEQLYPTSRLIAKYSQKLNLRELILKW